MSVTGVSSGSFSSNQMAPPYRLSVQEFQQLGQDLATGNLTGAQSDFAILQQAFSQPAASTSASTSSASSAFNPLARAFQQLSADLKSGNLAAAQKDYATVQQDLQSQFAGHLHHHHTVSSNWLDNSSNNLAGQDLFSPPGQPAGTAGPLTPTLLQQLQQYTLANASNPATIDEMSPVSFMA